MSISQIDIDNLIKGPAQNRFDYFVKKVKEEQKVWVLFGDNWALSATDDGKTLLPMWPDKAFAELCITNDWSKHEAVAIELEEVLQNLLPQLQAKDILPGVFFTLEDGSVEVDSEELIEALQQ